MGPGLGAVLLAVGAIVLAIVFGLRSDGSRSAAYERFATGAGLRVLPKGDDGREGLSSIPGLPGPGRLVWSPVARSEDEVMADVRVTRPLKEIRTDRRATLYAWRRAERVRPRFTARTVETSEHADPGPTGFGRLLVADDGVWMSCRTTGKRVPDERLAEFRDRARALLAARLEGDG